LNRYIMCYWCHTLGHNPKAPPHRSSRCIDPANSHGRRGRHAASTAQASAKACCCAKPETECELESTRGAGSDEDCEHCEGSTPECAICGDAGHTEEQHKCAVCSGTGHRGRDCPVVETEGLPGRRVTLYHKTSEESGRKIAASKTMRPGSQGMFGAGIYFCRRPSDCDGKAHFKGVLIKATVQLGRSLVCRKPAPKLSMAAVRKNDCISGFAPGGPGGKRDARHCVSLDEYVVYESWQVRRIEIHADKSVAPAQWPQWARTIASPGWQRSFQPAPMPEFAQPPPPAHGPLKADGTPDMRFKVNKQAAAAAAAGKGKSGCGPLKADGTPDMRFKANKKVATAAAKRAGKVGSRAPLKADGTPDMRFKANKQAAAAATRASRVGSRVPRKADGTPDMRFKANRQAAAAAAPRTRTSGGYRPLKADGTPDRRFKANRAVAASVATTPPRAPRFGSSGTTHSRSTSGVVYKRDGTPDMRYTASKAFVASGGYSSSSFSSSSYGSGGGGGSYGGGGGYGYSAPGPLKKDGTPDMRFKANW